MSQTLHLSIEGMSCAGCVASIEKAINDVDFVTSANVNFAEHTATVEGDTNAEAVIAAIRRAGYQASELSGLDDTADKEQAEFVYYRQLLKQAALAALVGAPLFIAGMAGMLPPLAAPNGLLFWSVIALATLGVMVYSGGHFFLGAVKSVRQHNANMDLLIALGTGTAWLYSVVIVVKPELVPALAQHVYFEAAAVIIALINLGSALEMRARGKTSQAIKQLIGLQPKTACVVRDNNEIDILIEEVVIDDILRVKPGERIAVDGVITQGHSSLDESMLSGEPLAVKKQPGDKVLAGTINKSGSFLFQAKRIGKDTTLAQIINMVRTAQSSKPAIGRLVDKIASVFVPAVLIIAVLTFLAWLNFADGEQALTYAIVTMMTVLIIACPCALGLATPISIMAGVGKAALYQTLIRNGDALQQAGKLETIVLDKTGTVTQGKPGISKIIPRGTWDENSLLLWAGSAEANSEHPLAEAIVSAVKELQLKLLPVTDFAAIAGQGIRAELENKSLLLGTRKLMQSFDINIEALVSQAAELEQEANTVIFIAIDGELAGIIAISDAIKDDSFAAIKRMHQLGLEVLLLTGDNRATASAVANQLGIDKVIAEVLPQDKAGQIAQLQRQGKVVAMVGDGINDAPALALADVGFAIGTGTDIAIESADITLMSGSLHGVVDAVEISRATVRNIKQNLFGAFIYNGLGIPIAAGVLFPFTGLLLNPMIAGAAMAMSSLTVVTNANRLRFFKPAGRQLSVKEIQS
ncbi:heavy metal translocating P-type ATPase [Thalassomonas actiniarum]|uniref:Copper-exporting P-type ATPase n=1 Tax=Thalassomonas actiniarum TaxID=485447 RepID=A0AAE9YL16_9GAMM|nr:heavy metal translocating P-type ATPase [Thalassomonas actiniarum]WDD97519.1 copper-translocating P-type ATPase [Thalassomonas actiniarum]